MTNTADNTTTTGSRKTFYWMAAGLASLALTVIGASDVVHTPSVIEGLTKLGYPEYFATIIGVWQLLGVTALLVPGFPRLKEWAYAGFFFTLTGASVSHAITRDPVGYILFPLALLGVLAVSWVLRPARAVGATAQPELTPAMNTHAYQRYNSQIKEIHMNDTDKTLATIFRRNWAVLLVRGIIAIAFGIMAWFMPQASLTTLILLFGFYSFLDGIFGIWLAIDGRKQYDDWWVLLSGGAIGIVIAAVTFIAPALTAIALLFYIAIWATATGVFEIMVAVRVRKEIRGGWAYIVRGLGMVLLGLLLALHPQTGALALLGLIASFAIVLGALQINLAFKVRAVGRDVIPAGGAVHG